MKNYRNRALSPSLLSVLAISVAAQSALSDDSGTAEPAGEIEEVYVTGSRIIRKDLEGSAPVTVLDAERLKISGATTVADVLRSLPSIVGNATTTSTTNGGGAGTADLTLRGLPSKQTLVLLNGRRMPNDGVLGVTPDLNMIPFSAVQQVEVLKEGASAVYGSDAIAGVVNIKLKKDFEGLQVNTYGGVSSRQDYPKQSIDVTYGNNFERGNMIISASYYDQGTIKSSDRDISKDLRRRSSYIPQATIAGDDLGSGIKGSYLPNTTGDDSSDFVKFDANQDGFNYQEYTDSMIEQEKRSVFSAARYEFDSGISGFFEGSYGQTFNSYNMAPTPMGATNNSPSVTYSAENDYNPFNRDIASIRRRFTELGPRTMLSENTMFRVVLGLEGELDNGWYWDVAYNFGESNTTQNTKNMVDLTRLRLAMGDSDTCRQLGCTPVDLFGAGSITPEMADYISTDGTEKGTAGLRSATANITGELFEFGSGYLAYAAGLEYREEYISFLPDGNYQNANTVGGTNLNATKGDRQVGEAYVEFLLPLFDERLELELAGRYSNYSDFGTTAKPKAGVKFRANDTLLLRASFAQGFRAPSLLELHRGRAESFDYLDDPCKADNVDPNKYNCAGNLDPTIQQYPTFYSGNTDLDPEESTSITVGMVWSPDYLTDFNFTLDYFKVSTENAVSSDANYIVDQYRQGNGYDGLVTTVNGEIQQVEAPYQNLAKREVRGIDLGIDTLFDVAGGDLTLRLETTRFLEYRNQGNKDAAYENLVGTFKDSSANGLGSIPELKGHFDIEFQKESWRYSWVTNYVSKLEETYYSEKKTLGEWITFDAKVGYNYQPWGLDIAFGVDNVTDREPPESLSGNDNIDAKTHNLIGRYYYTRIGWEIF